MMDIKTSSQPPPRGILHFFPTVGNMGHGKRECCADALLRMMSDSPPGHPKSCSASGAQCPFKLARPVESTSASTSTIIGSPEIIGNKAAINTGIFSTIFMGIISTKLIMIAVFVGGAMVLRSRLRRRNAGGEGGGGGGGGGGGPLASTTGDHSSESPGGAAPAQDEQALAWEVPYASRVAGSD